MTNQQLIDLALEKGATKAVVLNVDDIVFNEVFRSICESNGCGMSGKCWMCPPDVGPADQLIAKVRSYSKALLFQTITDLEDSFDFETMTEAGLDMTKLCVEMRKAVKELGDTLVLGKGGCQICQRCSRLDDRPCRRPEDAILSLEACCIDVSNTVRSTELKYINGADTVTYFGMVLFD